MFSYRRRNGQFQKELEQCGLPSRNPRYRLLRHLLKVLEGFWLPKQIFSYHRQENHNKKERALLYRCCTSAEECPLPVELPRSGFVQRHLKFLETTNRANSDFVRIRFHK